MPNWTPQQERDFNARMYGVAQKKCTEPVEREADLHGQILQECVRRGWIAFHGSMAHATFRTPGEPDMIIYADKGRTFAVECKARGGKLSPEQLGIHAWAAKLGHKVHVVFNLAEFMEITKEGLK